VLDSQLVRKGSHHRRQNKDEKKCFGHLLVVMELGITELDDVA
jgi:hypothetical protein